METSIARLLQDFETGKMSRRQSLDEPRHYEAVEAERRRVTGFESTLFAAVAPFIA